MTTPVRESLAFSERHTRRARRMVFDRDLGNLTGTSGRP